MGEPALDLSEIIDLYKDDARRMIGQMKSAVGRWEEIRQGGVARQELRKFSHQMRGSGRTYGFREATRLCKAMENLMLKLDNNKIPADDRLRQSLQTKVERLTVLFA
jgi:chemotaxis protein histidine kinase CheA